jgi:hypothetical protein
MFCEPLEAQKVVTSSNPAAQIDNEISGNKGIMLVSSGKLPQFTVSRCTDAQIFAARHARACDLQPSKDTIYVRLDAAQRGLGTGSCGKRQITASFLLSKRSSRMYIIVDGFARCSHEIHV